MPWLNTHAADIELSSSQSFSHADHADFDFTTAITFATWVKLESQPATDASMGFFYKDNGTDQRSYSFSYNDTSGVKSLALVASGTATASSVDILQVTQTLTNATWYHIAVTWDGATKTAKFYVNGAQSGSNQVGTAVASLYVGSAVVAIGANSPLTSGFYDGLMDDLRVWGRVLSASEISTLYSTPTAFSNGASLAAWWKFDNAATDSSGNTHTLTANNAPTYTTDIKWTGNTLTEVAGTPVEVMTALSVFTIPAISDVAGAPIEGHREGYGMQNQSKSSTTWTNQSKS